MRGSTSIDAGWRPKPGWAAGFAGRAVCTVSVDPRANSIPLPLRLGWARPTAVRLSGFSPQIGPDPSPAAPHPPAPLGARVRAPVGWRILDAPRVPPSPRERRERGEGWGEGHRRCDASVAATEIKPAQDDLKLFPANPAPVSLQRDFPRQPWVRTGKSARSSALNGCQQSAS